MATWGCAVDSASSVGPDAANQYGTGFVDFPSLLIGTWQWVSSTGGPANEVFTPLSLGVERTMRCTIPASCTFSENGVARGASNWHFTYEKIDVWPTPVFVIWVGNPPTRSNTVITTLDADKLVVFENCAQCYTHEYRRIRATN